MKKHQCYAQEGDDAAARHDDGVAGKEEEEEDVVDEDVLLDLLYSPELDCYYDPKTGRYYRWKNDAMKARYGGGGEPDGVLAE